MINEEIIKFYKDYVLKEFWDYIKDRVVIVPSGSDMCFYGCYPITKNNILIDIRVLVPNIETEKDVLINIHEFAHATELYNELGRSYIDNRDKREKHAKKMEKLYKKKQ